MSHRNPTWASRTNGMPHCTHGRTGGAKAGRASGIPNGRPDYSVGRMRIVPRSLYGQVLAAITVGVTTVTGIAGVVVVGVGLIGVGSRWAVVHGIADLVGVGVPAGVDGHLGLAG